MPARQCSRVDLPEPDGPITATASPARIRTLASTSAGVGPKDNRRPVAVKTGSGLVIADLPGQLVEARRGQLQPAQVGFQMEQREVTDQLVGQRAVLFAAGQLA